MSNYIMRLDDACEKMDVCKWEQMERLLDKYDIKPLVGVIPNCMDEQMDKYPIDNAFWDKVHAWEEKGWCIAVHGYDHVYTVTDCGGLNPINKESEFANVPIEIQKEKIRTALEIFRNNSIEPKVFFAPSHTFDKNTIKALKEESNIRIISDTIAFKAYSKYGITFVPQQSGRVRKLPFNTVTFCYHPNVMQDKDFIELESFLSLYKTKFIPFPIQETKRKKGLADVLVEKIYFTRRKIRESRA